MRFVGPPLLRLPPISWCLAAGYLPEEAKLLARALLKKDCEPPDPWGLRNDRVLNQ